MREHVSYDPDTGLLRVIKPWHRKHVGDVLGVLNDNGYMRTQLFGYKLYNHQWAHFFMLGYIPPYVDHRDPPTTNNAWSNLRAATQSQNMANGPPRVGRYRGVYRHSLGHKWTAAITVDYVTHYLGVFDDEDDAARAYNVAATRYWGEFARLNKM